MNSFQNLLGSPQSPFVIRTSLGGSGLRVAVKDNINIKGLGTTAGSRVYRTEPPALKSATIVQRLLAANFHIVGKTKLHELAFGITGINDAFGTPINPRFPKLIPGGSSSGSAAAVAASLADVAIGTDTGGSIRIPAACCGVFGLKPTFGRIPRDGVLPARSSLDCVGVFAQSVAHLETTMEALDPHYKREASGSYKLGFVAPHGNPEISDAITAAVRATGLPICKVMLAHFDSAFSAGLTMIEYETANAFRDLLDSSLIGDDVLTRLRKATGITAEDMRVAEVIRKQFREELKNAFETVDVLVLPTIADYPPPLADARTDRSAVSLTKNVRPFNLSGNPAIAVPLPSINERPVSLQIVGPMGKDDVVCAVARQFEACLTR
ncbi:amidase [Ochrobactrum sp. RH2CCR150]|uniref:amidase n=1 Tax=Ochrobactrum sp. RH2CCR150 TaxID=2587044 RepID=UPI0015F9F7AA|nr:amidase [Ochrobactrum sp. RH2CCR150]